MSTSSVLLRLNPNPTQFKIMNLTENEYQWPTDKKVVFFWGGLQK